MAPSRDLVNDGDSDFGVPNAKRRRISSGEEWSDNEKPSNDKEASGDSVTSNDGEDIAVPMSTSHQEVTSLSRISRIKRSDGPVESGKSVGIAPTRLAVRPADTDFKSLAVAPWLVHTLRSLSITSPTAIQQSCIPPILDGRDCIGGSRTGSGKTIAFAVPLLQKWAEDPFGIYAVVLTPTRELALQIYEQFRALGASQNLKVVLITGGTEMRPQAIALAQKPHIVVATPGRLADHIQTSGKDTVIGLSRAKAVVLDEADRLLKSGPGSMLPDLNTCLSALPPPSSRLTLLFTATVTPEVRFLKAQPRNGRPPVFISEISDSSSNPSDPTNGAPTLPPTLTQTYLQLPAAHKPAYLHVLLQTHSMTAHDPSIIIFTNRTTTADHLHRTFLQLEHPVTALHSALPQRQRSANLTSFRARKSRILIATDVASRGLDIPSVRFVVNYDVPRDPADYVHRVGRTARAGRDGTAITFTGPRDVELVLAIEEYLQAGGGTKMQKWEEEGVNLETRIVKGRTLKDVEEARMEALREVEQGKDVYGRRIGKGRKVRS
jgi:ATP-dependent RNA helicase DDX49/DBP8